MIDFIPKIHKYESTVGMFYVNAFLVESANSVVAIDATLANSSVADLRSMINDKIKKPLVGVLLTHGHPDHYTGVAELIKGFGDIPVIATEGTLAQAHSRDAEESGYLGSPNAFGQDYPAVRVFPNQIVKDGFKASFDDVEFTLEDLGPCESDDDTTWTINVDNVEHVFSGDIVYNYMHTFFRDGHSANWLKQLDYVQQKYNINTVFHGGHGADYGIETIYWQKSYNLAFLRLLKELVGEKPTLNTEEQQLLFTRMQQFLPNTNLLFLSGWQFDDMVNALRIDGIL
jgi:glyoxylase-like metal-dependent hydrolase (beta-lactamase superfamily II)